MVFSMFSALFVFVCSWALTAGLTPPTIIFPPNDLDEPLQAKDTRDLNITCKATGSLPMTFTWKKNGKEYKAIIPYRRIKNGKDYSTITIARLNPYDDGKYQCLVRNAAGGTFSRKLRVKVTTTEDFKQGTDVQKTVNVTVGRPLYLSCPDHKSADGHVDFGAIHSWGRKINQYEFMFLQMKDNRAILPNGDLIFTYVSEDDIKELTPPPSRLQLQCFVEAGALNFRSLVYQLRVVKTDNTPFAPQFIPGGQPIERDTAVQGKDKFLHCIANGNPAPTTKWFRVLADGTTKPIIHEKDGFVISKPNFGKVLHITKVFKEQHEPGYYKCEVSNSQGKVTSKLIKITVYVAPEWTVKPPPVKTIPVLGDAELVCEAMGTPTPKYKWYHNGTDFKSDTELSPHFIVNGNKLLIKGIEKKNEGVFQCAVENDWGMIVSSTWIKVEAGHTPPTIIFPPDDLDEPLQAKDTRDLSINCKATGSLPMTFTWKKSDKSLGPHLPYRRITNGKDYSTLTITRLTPYDDGKYQCLVRNAAGGTFSRKLRVKVTTTAEFKEGPDVQKIVNVTVGRPLYLPCPDHKSAVGHADFGVVHTWGRKLKRMNIILQTKDNRAILPNGDLFFTYVSEDDIKELTPSRLQLQCFVEAGALNQRSLVYQLQVVKTDNTTFAPKFISGGEPMQRQTAVEGKDKSLHCVASGNPAPKTKWFRVLADGTTKPIIHEKDGFVIPKRNFGKVLHITKVFKEQHEPGYYKCEVSNSQGTVASKLIKITVFVAPEWTVKPPPVKTIPVLGDAELVCEAVGTPTPKHKWYHNGIEFKFDTELSPHFIVNGNKLSIKGIEKKNEGVFQCAVENDWGMIVSSTWIKVEVRAPKIKTFGPLYFFRKTNTVLECNSNAAPVARNSWYKNDQLITISGRYSVDAKNSLVIADVVTADEGKYTCKAKNDFGEDTASDNASVYDRTEIFRPPKKNLFITLKKPLDLHCEATADERLKQFLTYKWLKDGREIQYNSRVRWIENQNILMIEDANVNDGAMYTCIAFTNASQRSEDRATAIADLKGVPSPPSDLKITDCANRTTIITWKKGKDNDAPITHLVIEQESTYFPEEWHVIANITDPTVTSHTLQLTAWANLIFRMRAVNKIGPSRASMPTAKGLCILNMYWPRIYPRNFRGVPGRANELDIVWKPMTKLEANAPGLHYILEYNKILDNRNKEKYKVEIKDPSTDHFSVPNAGYYQLWEFRITAKNIVGEGPSSDFVKSFSGQDAPKSKPENVKMGKISARSIELLWNRVLVTRGSVDGYKIYHWGQSKLVEARRPRRDIPIGAKVFKAMSTNENVQKQNFTGLTPYTSYTFAIKALNSGGEGPPSDEVKFDTLEDVPGPVSDFNAQAFSSYIFANWGEPVEKNGILLGYSIGALKHENNEAIKPVSQVQFVDLPIDKFEHLFKDMEPETRYVIYLQAKTGIGAGPVMKSDVRTIAPAIPTVPRAPLAHSTTAVNITFLFGNSPGGYPLEFMIKYREKGTNKSFKETRWFDHLEKRWAVVANLSKSCLYQFVTVGRNKLGSSLDSPPTDACLWCDSSSSNSQVRPMPVSAPRTPDVEIYVYIVCIALLVVVIIILLVIVLKQRKQIAITRKNTKSSRPRVCHSGSEQEQVSPDEAIPLDSLISHSAPANEYEAIA